VNNAMPSVPVRAPVKVRAAVISLATGVAILILKSAAYLLTGSVALLSDAAESVVNVLAANIALISLVVAARPPDEGHQYGHAKAEYVSSATEGAMIGVAGGVIIVTAVERLLNPQPLTHLPLGLALLTAAAVANLAVSLFLLRISRQGNSIALEASARHLQSDVMTSAGVFLGLGLVTVTGWAPLDPIAALLVGGNILWMGVRLFRRSIEGLMDARLPPEDEARIRAVFDSHQSDIINYHAMRTRRAGADRYLDLHLVLHRSSTVGEAHELTDHLEQDLEAALPGVDVLIHVEPCEPTCPRCGVRRGTARPRITGHA
jgi:cation diffusion facilitator family transporter